VAGGAVLSAAGVSCLSGWAIPLRGRARRPDGPRTFFSFSNFPQPKGQGPGGCQAPLLRGGFGPPPLRDCYPPGPPPWGAGTQHLPDGVGELGPCGSPAAQGSGPSGFPAERGAGPSGSPPFAQRIPHSTAARFAKCLLICASCTACQPPAAASSSFGGSAARGTGST
jgi:hypothetical protein